MKRFLSSLALLFNMVLMSANVSAETVTFIHNDVLGNPVAATDEAGNVIWREDFRPYGDKRIDDPAAANRDVWYTGKPYEKRTGLSYFGARYYDPTVGRFTGMDPVPFDGQSIHTFNRYAYANNNPYKYVDPDGRFADTPFDLGMTIYDTGEFIGAGVAYLQGVITGDQALRSAAGEGLISSGIDLGGDVGAVFIPFLPAGSTKLIRGGSKKIGDLDPLHSAETIGDRADLRKLSDSELLESVTNPKNGDKIKISTNSGKVVDGNSRTLELQRRAADPNSSISPDTKVPFENYTPDNSMFPDL